MTTSHDARARAHELTNGICGGDDGGPIHHGKVCDDITAALLALDADAAAMRAALERIGTNSCALRGVGCSHVACSWARAAVAATTAGASLLSEVADLRRERDAATKDRAKYQQRLSDNQERFAWAKLQTETYLKLTRDLSAANAELATLRERDEAREDQRAANQAFHEAMAELELAVMLLRADNADGGVCRCGAERRGSIDPENHYKSCKVQAFLSKHAALGATPGEGDT